MNKTYLLFITIVFIIIAAILVVVNNIFSDATGSFIQAFFLHAVNLTLYALSIVAFLMHQKAIAAKTNFEFTSKTISVTAIRMVAIILLIACYVVFSKTSIHLMSLLSTMFFYFTYNFIEMFFLLKGIRKNKNEAANSAA